MNTKIFTSKIDIIFETLHLLLIQYAECFLKRFGPLYYERASPYYSLNNKVVEQINFYYDTDGNNKNLLFSVVYTPSNLKEFILKTNSKELFDYMVPKIDAYLNQTP